MKINYELYHRYLEAIYDRPTPLLPKLAKGISHTVYPDAQGDGKCYQQSPRRGNIILILPR